MRRRLAELFEYRELLNRLVYQNLYQRYHGSFLGFLWTLLYPLLVFVSFSVIFSVLNRWNLKDYGIFFFAGYLVWTFFSNSCLWAAESVVGNPVYVTRVYIPRALLPLTSVALNLVDLAAAFIVLVIVMFFVGARFSLAMLFLPVSLLLTIMFVAGVAMLCAVANVFFRDFRYILASLFFIWFFFSPILWKPEGAPAQARYLLDFNPVVPFLTAFQYPIWKGLLPPAESMLVASLYAAAAFVAGFMTFFGTERKFYYYL